jgi:diguanylate cyclase (GGDEF)-like protein
MLHRQLSAHADSLRASALGNLVNGSITGIVFFGSVPFAFIAAWCLILALMAVWRWQTILKIPAAQGDPGALKALSRAIDRNAAAHGIFWGVLPGLLFSIGSPAEQMYLGILAGGMLNAGTITFRTLERAAKIYVASAAPGLLFAFLALHSLPGLAAAGLLVCYAAVLFGHIDRNARNFKISNERERALSASSEMIQLLLNDYAEHGTDWLIELDAQGCVLPPSARLADATHKEVAVMVGKPFADFVYAGPPRDQLLKHISQGRSFRHHAISVRLNNETHWWSISARPAQDAPVAYRGVVTDITAQRQAEEKVSYMAHYDGLTDLPNRFHFNESLHQVLDRGIAATGLMYLDLDQFKAINDTLGHPVGDQLLKAVARRLERCVSDGEIVARLGGDEFAVIVPGHRLDRIDELASRIVQALNEPFRLGDHDVIIGASVGIACAPQDATVPEELLRNADLALYAAKAGGRNRALRFEPEMDRVAQARRLIEMDLRRAIGGNEMRLHFQTLVSVESGETIGHEALIRWEHPERGIVMPGDFIPVAEETGMIIQIGEWVIREALSELALWAEHLDVSINLSTVQMRSPTLIGTLVNALASTGVNPGRVCLEITESVLMQDSEANLEILHKLKSLGVRIALDDFGTGYSSLNYLRSFPFDKIKIDRCFVSEIDTREDCRAIVRSIVELANSLGMATTAEGVERDAQITALRAEGCGEAQGYLFSRAVPPEELSDLRQPRPLGQALPAPLALIAPDTPHVRSLAA